MLDIKKCPELGMHKMSDEDYFKVPALSNSGISLFIKAPAKFKHMMLEGFSGSTPTMIEGSLYHCNTLTPDLVHEAFYVAEETRKNTKAGKEAHAEAESLGLQIVNKTLLDKMEELRANLMKHKTARTLLNHPASIFEHAIFWVEEIDGLKIPCKAKLDIWNPEMLIAADLKSTKDASLEFAKSIANYGYHRQAMWYVRGLKAIGVQHVEAFAFFCQEKEPPYMTAAYRISSEDEQQALKEIKRALIQLAELVKANEWADCYNESVEVLDMPYWAKKEIEL